MNERIEKLAEQAGGYVSLSYEHDGKLILSGEDIVQKFAELIVKECLSVIEEMNPHDPERNIDDIFDEVDEHFGVEE